MKKTEIIILCIALLALSFIFGCQEQQKKVWGKGNPPAEWQEHFGNDNKARLDYIQTNRINSQGQAMAELTERVRKLEDGKKAENTETAQ